MDIIIKGLRIHTANEQLENASIAIDNGKIVALNSNYSADHVIEFPADHHLIPGMIDMHIHGAKKADIMDGKLESLSVITQTLPAEGTTAFLATTMSEPIENIDRALTTVAEFCQNDYSGAEILGIHLEGPFISKNRVGAQREECVLKPDLNLFKQWQKISNNLIKQVTVAPEEDGAIAFIQYLVSENIIASLGHSDANYAQAMAAIEAGCSHATHLFNAMKSLKHRDPNAVTALLNSAKVTTELIVDGIHLHPAIVELAYKIKSCRNVVLITDAMRAKCCCDGKYTLGGQEVIVKGNEARLIDGTLAGSVLTMDNAIKNTMKYTGCNLSDIIQMTATNPAELLSLSDRKGSIAINKDADLVVLNANHDIMLTLCRGQISYHAKN